MTTWYFSYGTSTLPRYFAQEIGTETDFRPAHMDDHALFFANYRPEWGGGTSCLIEAEGDRVLGTAYAVSDDVIGRLESIDEDYHLVEKQAVINGEATPAVILQPKQIGDFARPSDAYVAKIREGLASFHPMYRIDDYLTRALRGEGVFKGMQGLWANEADFPREYGIGFRRIAPVDGFVASPWGAAWGKVGPGEASELYVHDEEEIAVVIGGEGKLRLNDSIRRIGKGDIVYFQPNCEHVVENDTEATDLEILFVWWGGSDPVLWAGHEM